MKRALLAVAVLAALALTVSTVFAAGGTKVCLPEKEGKPIVTPKSGVCKAKYTLTELGAEGKEGAKGEKGEKGEKGSPGFAGAVSSNGSIFNGEGFTVSNPTTGEYEIHLPTFGLCTAAANAPDTTVTPFNEGHAVIADTVPACKSSESIITVTIFTLSGTPTENGFAFISQAG